MIVSSLLILYQVKATFLSCSESVSIYDPLKCSLTGKQKFVFSGKVILKNLDASANDEWKLNYYHKIDIYFTWKDVTVSSPLTWNSTTDEFENNELLETILKIWNNKFHEILQRNDFIHLCLSQ